VYDVCVVANLYMNELTDGVYFEERTEYFKYNNILNQKDLVENLLKFFKTIKNEYWFDFSEPENDDLSFINEKYMKFLDWWSQFEKLRSLIEDFILDNRRLKCKNVV
jgi:hypothetical protein